MLQLQASRANLAVYVLESSGKTIEDYDGWCGDVAQFVLNRYEGSMVHVEGPALDQYAWWYHMVPLVDGKIHDAWFAEWHSPEPLTLEEWLVQMFGTEDEISVMVEGEDVYAGLPQNFVPKSTDIPIPVGRGLTLAQDLLK